MMLAVVVVVVVAAAQCCSEVHAGEMDHYIKVRSSVNDTKEIMGNGTLAVPRMECGFLLCNASTVTTYDGKHYWDYYVEWEMPREVQDDTAVFQMGNEYQMPHSYLVFRSFKSNFTGRYRCHLHFRGTRVGSHTVYLTLHKSLSSRNCYH